MPLHLGAGTGSLSALDSDERPLEDSTVGRLESGGGPDDGGA